MRAASPVHARGRATPVPGRTVPGRALRSAFALALVLSSWLCSALAWAQTPPPAVPAPAPAAETDGAATTDPASAAAATDPAAATQAPGTEPSAPPDAAFPTEEGDVPPATSAPRLPLSDLELAEGLPIERIDVTGNRRVSSGDIASYLRQKVGEPLRGEQLRRDVRELWRAGFFDDIEVDLRQSETGVTLRFHVKERPAIRAVEFEGNEELKSDDLAEAIEIKVDTILSPPALRRAV